MKRETQLPPLDSIPHNIYVRGLLHLGTRHLEPSHSLLRLFSAAQYVHQNPGLYPWVECDNQNYLWKWPQLRTTILEIQQLVFKWAWKKPFSRLVNLNKALTITEPLFSASVKLE